MNWFSGDVTAAIQKTIAEKKVFLVFIYDENDDSKLLDEIWHDEQVSGVCGEDRCVSVKLKSDSVGGQQFSSIYPILNVPCTYLISSDGIPSEVIPGCPQKQEYIERLKIGIEKTLASTKAVPKDDTNTAASSSTQSTDSPNKNSVTEVSTSDNNTDVTTKDSDVQSSNINSNDASQTDEDKKKKAEALLEKSRQLRAQKEKEKQKEEEHKRRQEGLELTRARKDLAERQARNLSEEIAKQRAEERAAREKVRQQIKQDRAEKAARREKEIQERKAQSQVSKESSLSPTQPKVSKSSTSRIQFKLPDGSTHAQQFDADDKFHVVLSAAQQSVQHLQIPIIRLTTVFPRHEFTVDDNTKSLRELNLVPTASIIISKGVSQSSQSSAISSSQLNPFSIISLLLSPIIAILQWLASLFTTSASSTQNRDTSQQSNTNDLSNSNRNTNSTSSNTVRRRPAGGSSNIRQLRNDDSSDNENGTWNGNSTQQM